MAKKNSDLRYGEGHREYGERVAAELVGRIPSSGDLDRRRWNEEVYGSPMVEDGVIRYKS